MDDLGALCEFCGEWKANVRNVMFDSGEHAICEDCWSRGVA